MSLIQRSKRFADVEKSTIAALFGIAILMAIVRTTIRIRTQRRLLPDD